MAVGQNAIPPVPWQKRPAARIRRIHCRRYGCMDAIRGITQSLIQSGNMTCMSLVFLSRFEFLDQSILHIARHEFVVCEVHDK